MVSEWAPSSFGVGRAINSLCERVRFRDAGLFHASLIRPLQGEQGRVQVMFSLWEPRVDLLKESAADPGRRSCEWLTSIQLCEGLRMVNSPLEPLGGYARQPDPLCPKRSWTLARSIHVLLKRDARRLTTFTKRLE